MGLRGGGEVVGGEGGGRGGGGGGGGGEVEAREEEKEMVEGTETLVMLRKWGEEESSKGGWGWERMVSM